MDGAPTLLLLLQTLLVFGNTMVAAGYNEDGGRELGVDIPEYIIIDCGAPEGYSDEGISYKSDAEFIDSGINGEISTEFINDDLQQSKNLRSFPNGTRNCYTLKPRNGKNNRYMIRATFMYGNYDGKNKVPVFDLYLGVNRWITVNLDDSSTSWYYEIIHVPSTDYIHVCLVNTRSGTPFISSLELRLLDNSIYQYETGALALQDRFDVGVNETDSDQTVRYQNDVYGRIWAFLDPQVFSGWLPYSTTSAIESPSNDDYKVPEAVLNTAAQSPNASVPLTFSWNLTKPSPRDYYYIVYFHFTETEKVGQRREMEISLNDGSEIISIGIEYLKRVTKFSPLIKGPLIEFDIYATEGSDLPPILNALEVFELKELSNSSTAVEDVDAIMKIKQAYQVTRNWQGDPCAPSDYSWDGLSCNINNPLRIISLNLSSSNLTGEIAGSISDLKEIQYLDLSNNELTGPLPEGLAKLPNLKILNLTGNNLIGSVPLALEKLSRDGTLQLSLDKNQQLCLTNSCKAKSKKFVIPVVASAVSVLLLLILLGALAIFRRFKRSQRFKRRQQGGVVIKSNDVESKSRRFSYSEVVRITENFQTVLGEGGFGKVFLGTLKDDTQVAVKLLSASSKQGFKEFRSEAQLLMVVHHRNLVSLIGYCDEGKNMALIYEYMANGNLRQHLSGTKANILNWHERLQIAMDAAHGLEYLHNGCKPSIIHRDVKTSNILLDKKMQAKIADFGLSRVLATENDTHVSTRPSGTPGYLDPEFHSSGNLNKKSDVYSFGIILFELITGQDAIIRGPENNCSHMLQWIRPIIERGDIRNIIDPRLQGEFDYNSAWKALEIAISCVPSMAIQRPDMSHILSELKECLAIEMATGITQTTGSYDTGSTNPLETELELELSPIAR